MKKPRRSNHFHATRRSVSAAIGGVVVIAAAFRWLSKDQAEAVTIGLAPILALLIPSRRT